MKLWTFLRTDVRELNLKQAEEVVKTGSDTAKAVLDLAKAVKEQGNKVEISALQKVLQEYGGQFSSLLDVLNSPLAQIIKDSIPFAPLAITILKLISEATQREPTLEQCMALVSQTAYLDSLRSLLAPYVKSLEQKKQKKASDGIARQLKQLGEQEFSDQDAKDALLNFPNSKLAKEFNRLLKTRLQETGFSEAVASNLTARIAWNTPRYINEALAKNADTLKPLAELYRNGGRELLERFQSIESYLKTQIRPLPDEVIFQEESILPNAIHINYREMYVPLKGQLLDCDGRTIKDTGLIPLNSWMIKTLNDTHKTKHLMFIQGEAGRGKSVFCRMMADQVSKSFYPSYTPILIRLRGLRTLTNRLQDTLASAPELQNCDFVTSDSGWLTDANIRFLFFLDGFDELLLEGRVTGGLQEFLQQVEQFQHNSHHRFVITGRPLALLQVERLISQTRNIERVELQPMDDELIQQWVTKWEKKAGTIETQKFQQFLKTCPEDLKTLAREPLLMYLLARMHREEDLNALLAEDKGLPAKIQIYDAAIKWVLEKQRQNENIRLTGLDPDELRQFLAEAATCVVQSGNEIARISMLEGRLKDCRGRLANFLEKARQQPVIKDLNDSKALNNLLASFYLKPTSGEQGGCIEFVHKSFGEFLFAERLLEALEDWAEEGGRRQAEFLVKDQEVHQELYNLLGYGGLTPDIISYLTPRLAKLPKDSLIALFQRLNGFYDRWCDREFLDAELPTLPQQTMSLLKTQGIKTGLHQVDVYTGLNVIILLLELHRYARTIEALKDKMVFYPNGKLLEGSSKHEYTDHLLKVIYYSDAVALATFTNQVGTFLSRANLSRANLSRTNLSRAILYRASLDSANFDSANLSSAILDSASLDSANLSSAILDSANLNSANLDSASLDSANLNSANLSRASLSRASLSRAILSRTNLSRAILSRANLSRADLQGADLTNAILTDANLENITWDEETKWFGVKGLGTARNVPEKLKQQLGLQ